MKKFRIFVDLDDTLIYSKVGGEQKQPWKTHKFGGKHTLKKFKKYTMAAVARPMGYQLLEFVRSIDPDTMLLTAATREWAEVWNSAFDFGFTIDQIQGRDDDFVPLGIDDGGAVMIDNNDGRDHYTDHAKIQYIWGQGGDMAGFYSYHHDFFDNHRKQGWIQIKCFPGLYNSKDFLEADQREFERIKQIILEKVEQYYDHENK
jgi:hypothetical protein